MSIRVLIVDDEFEAREGVRLLLEKDRDVHIVGLCKNGVEAIDMINSHQIDLVFLDIQMPVISGFEVINSISPSRLPYIIFITAYDQFALKAFEVHAIDYILKPFTDQRFQEGLSLAKSRVKQKKTEDSQARLSKIAQEQIARQTQHDPLIVPERRSDEEVGRLIVKENGKVSFVLHSDILWIEAFDYYVKIHVKGSFHLVRESMKKIHGKLTESQFVRIHKSTIVNRQYITEILKGTHSEYVVKLSNNIELKVSRSYKQEVRELMR